MGDQYPESRTVCGNFARMSCGSSLRRASRGLPLYVIGWCRVSLAVTVAFLAPVAAPARAAPISSHAQLYACCTPSAMKERIFAESKAMGAAYVRVDVQMNDIFEHVGKPAEKPDWRGLDEVIERSRRYELPVLGVILHAPAYISTCPERWPDSARCAAAEPAAFGRLAGEIAGHARGTIQNWEIVNEPDGDWAFEGTPEQYAWMLSAAYAGIKEHAPEARVVLGGVMRPHDPAWLERVFATPGADAVHRFDVANLHLRGRASDVISRFQAFRAQLASHGFSGPLWVTEHGYPADPAFQIDPAFTGGEPGQAAYLTESLDGLGEVGADQVFVTLRDNLGGEYASEGVEHIEETGTYEVQRREAFGAVRRLVDAWDQLMAWRAEQRQHEYLERVQRVALSLSRIEFRIARKRFHAVRALLHRVQANAASRKRVARVRVLLATTKTAVQWRAALVQEYGRQVVLHALAAADLRRRI